MTFPGSRVAQALALAVLTAPGLLGGCSDEPPGPGSGVAAVTVTPHSVTLLVGATRLLSATVRDANGTVLPGRPVTWTTLHAAVATVSAGGLVTGIVAGSAAVIATSEGVSDTAAITVTTTNAFLSVNAGGNHTCGLRTSGVAYCWGANGRGQLGDGSTTSSPVPAAVTGGLTFYAVTVSAVNVFSCGLTTSGAPYCWGSWADGFTGHSSVPKAVPGRHEFSDVTAGGWFEPSHACGLTTTGAVYCWGANPYGQLGNGTTGGPEYCGGGGCHSVPVAVAGGLSFTAVSAGGDHTCGLTIRGAAYCWGDNAYGQLGDGSTTSSPVPVAVSGGLTFSTLSAGMLHTCGVTTSGAVYCWGFNGAGQLGDRSIMYRSVPVPVSGGLTFFTVSAGGNNTCGVTTTGAAYCWGVGSVGSLGTGEEKGPDQCEHAQGPCSRTPVAVAGGLTFARLSTRGLHSCGITVGSIAYCWGFNKDGQLGTGDATGPEQCGQPGFQVPCSTRPVAVTGQR